jgi:hypothetical protein
MSTCVGAPAPHVDCPHGVRCDWRPTLDGYRMPTLADLADVVHRDPFAVPVEPVPPKQRPVPPSARKRSRVTPPDPLARRMKALRRRSRR